MKKSLLAIALMGAFAGSAFAQSSVTMYGTVDIGVSANTKNGSADKFGAAVDSDGADDSRWGLKGSEDLGNGTKAIFQLEGSLNPENGNLGNGTVFNRHAYAGLATNYGTVVFGRTRDFQDTFVAPYSTAVNQFTNKYGWSLHDMIGDNMSGVSYDRMIKATTANYSGFQAGGFYGHKSGTGPSQAAGDAASLDTAARKANKAYGLGVNFARSNFGVGAAWTHETGDTHYSYPAKKDIFGLGANFSVAQVGINGTFSYVSQKNVISGLQALADEVYGFSYYGNGKRKGWVLDLGTTYKINPKMALGISAQYAQDKLTGSNYEAVGTNAYALASEVKTKAWQLNLVADYALSKRTDVYGGLYYQHVKDKYAYGYAENVGGVLYSEGDSFSSTKYSVLPGKSGTTKAGLGMRVGLRHSF